jgi:hypothetical protein
MPRPNTTPGRRFRGSTSGRPITALLALLGKRRTLRGIWELRASPGPTFASYRQAVPVPATGAGGR